MRNFLLLSIVFVFIQTCFGQTYFLKGTITSSVDDYPLSFANIRILGTLKGTAANSEGMYQLKLNNGKYDVVASFIGYKSLKISQQDSKCETFLA